MYNQIFTDMKSLMQPVVELAETNKKAMEKLASLQKDSMTDVVNASVAQFKELAQCKDPKVALEKQLEFYKTLEAKMTDTAEKSIATMTEAKEAFVAVVEESAKQTAVEVEAAVKKASSIT